MGGLRRVYLARPRGFCAGVVMAIEAVERWAEALKEKGELVVYHEIVHNRVVVERLKAKGVHFVEDLAEVERLRQERRLADTVVFSAHGHPPAVRRQAAEMGLTVLDATCPLVTKVHTEARRYAEEGYWILLIGDSADHQEIKGTYGEAPERTLLVAVHTHVGKDPRLADPRTVEVPDPEKVVVLTQTTLSVDDTLATIGILKKTLSQAGGPRPQGPLLRHPEPAGGGEAHRPQGGGLPGPHEPPLLQRDAPFGARPKPGGPGLPAGAARGAGGGLARGRGKPGNHLRRQHPRGPGAGGGGPP